MNPPVMIYLAEIGFGTELIYSFAIILCSLMIYFGTKELYELSYYKGIRYFRNTFLFFAIAYLLRSVIKFALVSSDVREIFEISPRFLVPVISIAFMYFSSMAIFFLLYSILWKKWEGSFMNIKWFHAFSVIIAIVSSSSRNPAVHFGVSMMLLMFVAVIVGIANVKPKIKKKRNSLYVIYMLLFIFLILNILDIMVPSFLQTYKLLIYLSSMSIFLIILYRVLKKTGSD